MTEPTAPRDWDATSYHLVATPHLDWGAAVLDRLALHGDETVLDAGCGTGRVTAMLADRLPRGRVLAVDASASMVARARETLGHRADVTQGNLLALELDEPVDAIVSTATFHWIPDHDALFARLHAALAPGGRLVAQCGGEGNIASVVAIVARVGSEEPFAAHLADQAPAWRHYDAQQTAARLQAAGFTDVECWLQPWPVTPPRPREFMATVVLGAQLDRLPEHLRAAFVDRVVDEMGPSPTLDYVRLNLVARRAAG